MTPLAARVGGCPPLFIHPVPQPGQDIQLSAKLPDNPGPSWPSDRPQHLPNCSHSDTLPLRSTPAPP
eukprot:320828-Chlamydomonas_euryale.AAC.3